MESSSSDDEYDGIEHVLASSTASTSGITVSARPSTNSIMIGSNTVMVAARSFCNSVSVGPPPSINISTSKVNKALNNS